MAYQRAHGVDTRIVRIFNTYGERMRPRDGRVVPALIGQALAGEPMTVFGDGSQTRSFCYVSDLIEGIYRLLLSDVRSPSTSATRPSCPCSSSPEEIQKLTGTKSEIDFKPLPGRRSEGPPAGHHQGEGEARLGAEGRSWTRG